MVQRHSNTHSSGSIMYRSWFAQLQCNLGTVPANTFYNTLLTYRATAYGIKFTRKYFTRDRFLSLSLTLSPTHMQTHLTNIIYIKVKHLVSCFVLFVTFNVFFFVFSFFFSSKLLVFLLFHVHCCRLEE